MWCNVPGQGRELNQPCGGGSGHVTLKCCTGVDYYKIYLNYLKIFLKSNDVIMSKPLSLCQKIPKRTPKIDEEHVYLHHLVFPLTSWNASTYEAETFWLSDTSFRHILQLTPVCYILSCYHGNKSTEFGFIEKWNFWIIHSLVNILH